MDRLIRTELLIGKEGIESLQNKKILLFGVGGVGGHVAEVLVRSGINKIDVVDADVVTESNINRQIIATYKTIGKKKVDVIKERLLDINPNATINTYPIMYLPNNDDIDFTQYDYIIDAIDTVMSKVDIILKSKKLGIEVISAMGAGNKLDATMFEITDIYKTTDCPLARVIRQNMKKNNIKKLNVVYSKAKKIKPRELKEDINKRKKTPGSIAYSPAICGLLIAQKVILDLLERG